MSTLGYAALAVGGAVVVVIVLAWLGVRRIRRLSERATRAEVERDAAQGNEEKRREIQEMRAENHDRESALAGIDKLLDDEYGGAEG